jgi:hypothetical protein
MFDLSNLDQPWPWQWASLAKKVVFLSLEEARLRPFRGPNWRVRDLGSLAMFQIPAYDPVAIMMMGFGVLLAAALAFVL